MQSNQFNIQQERAVPYYEETQKRTLKQRLVKVRNTILSLLAYRCPNNKLRVQFHRWRGVHIGKNVYIGMFCYFDNLQPTYIYIEDGASINAGTMILTHFNPMKHFENVFEASVKPVLIRNGAIVAVRSTIMPGVEIGERAVVSACSLVEKDVPPFTLVKGVPAKQISNFEALM